jgi:hypothetical protein
MKRIAALLALGTLVGGCGFMKRTFGRAEGPAYREPNSTAVWGTWVLRTPDSTAFVGASNVQLVLNPGTFTLVATYPNAPTVNISGVADLSDRGVLTLTPQSSVSSNAPMGRALRFSAGQPVSLLASASGNTLVFSPEHRNLDPTPSSVWNKFDAAKEAGLVGNAARAVRDSSRP